MNMCTRWWLRDCLKCRAQNNITTDGPLAIISMPLPEGPGIAVNVDHYGPVPVTPRGNTYILPFAYRFSRRANMHAVNAAEFTAEGTANILINRYIPPGDAHAAYSRTCLLYTSPSPRDRG